MLVYAYEVLKSREYKNLSKEEFKNENIYDLLSKLLICGTDSIIKRGLSKNYIEETEEISTVRGKIDVKDSIKRLSFIKSRLVCTFDEFSENIYINKIIKATFRILLTKNCHNERDIKKSLSYFSEIEDINVKTIRWDCLKFDRNNKHYDMLLYFCRLICDEYISGQNQGKKKFADIGETVLFDLYEKFVLEFYKKHKNEHSYTKVHSPVINWEINDDPSNKNTNYLPRMRTDIVLERFSEKQLIIDTKFYKDTITASNRSENRKIKSENIYQIYSYINNSSFTDRKSVV